MQIKSSTYKYGRTIADVYSKGYYELVIKTTHYGNKYTATIQETIKDGEMSLPLEGGLFKLLVERVGRYSAGQLDKVHALAQSEAISVYGDLIGERWSA
jgi:hypothetical protein